MANRFREEVLAFFEQTNADLAEIPELAEVRASVVRAAREIAAPMRIAVVGRIKAGKSTLMNAFLGGDIVPTGTSELTFNVNVFRYGEPGATIQFRDGRREPRPISDLPHLVARQPAKGEFLRSIRHVEVTYPNELLREFDLIDTPGLDSMYELDTKNTLDYLGIAPAEVEAWTSAATGDADAILYVFSKTPTDADVAALRGFHGRMAGLSPVNALGVLSRIDDYFPQEQEPVARAEKLVSALQSRHPEIPATLFLVHPLCGLLGAGAQMLTEDDLAILRCLAAVEPAVLQREVWNRDAEAFRIAAFARVPQLPPAEARQRVAARLGFYGCRIAVDLLREGMSFESLKQTLLARSGVARLRDLMTSHFGHRALLIKLSRRLEDIINLRYHPQVRAASPAARETVERIAARCSAIRATSGDLRDFHVLRSHYDGTLDLTPNETRWLLEISGELGWKAHQRLGFESEMRISEMKEAAERRMLHFRQAAALLHVRSHQKRDAARALEDAYARLLEDLTRADDILDRSFQ